MKTKLFFYLMLLVGLNVNAQTINVSTGVDNLGNALPVGVNDPNWQIVSNPTPKSCGYHPLWQWTPLSGTNAGWINDTGFYYASNPAIYTFERPFAIAAGTSNFTCNFGLTADENVVSVVLVRPDLTTISLTIPPHPTYIASSPITNVIASPMAGTWKIRVVANFFDSTSALLVTGTIIKGPTLPTINVCLPASKDTSIGQFSPNSNYGSNTILNASRWTYNAAGGTGYYNTKALFQFDLSTIPVGATITSAIMKLHVDTTDSNNRHVALNGGNDATITQVGSPWGENTVTWNNQPSLLTTSLPCPITTVVTPATTPTTANPSTSDVVVTVTTMVQNMFLNCSVNNGFEIKMTNPADYYHWLSFASRENTSSGGIFRPELCVSYTLPPSTNTTQIQASQCGTTIPTLATTIRANWVTGATNYRFRITRVDANNSPTTAPIAFQATPNPNGTNNIALSNVPGIVYDARYRIEVEVQLNGVWQNTFGPPCTITTPNPISTIGAQCGTTLTAMNQWINATIVPNITTYLFRVTQLDSSLNPIGSPQIIPSGTNKFNMTQSPLTGILYGTTYRVEVALRNTDGTDLPYNAACNITTPAFPTTNIRPLQCGLTTTTSNSTDINAVIVFPATDYGFRLTNNTISPTYSQTFFPSGGIGKVRLSNFTGLLTCTTYIVQVQLKIGGVWGPFGPPCTITTSGVGCRMATHVKSSPIEFNAIAYPNPFASSFLIDVKTASEAQIQYRVYDMLGKLVEDKTVENEVLSVLEIGAAYPTGIYNIIITQENNRSSLRVIKR